ncbi:hypothetical protein RE428_14890 [Marinobacter nanhaiticus D15-8W]|uniref:Uncharacterized protein n=1 Tax=Marinobacter nanhaiticus D15-8W TaxID=626887 RepID=N6VZ13_9GAMM|nr:hypothetical protein [Marinobacter nanhaiticus]ENO13114.1 hypothetical protein J057_16990 [Marinobacter nanhaiticus D15-8W]BES70471.1 hypothetical protein RE428_14890 [Marinobacter nanhaiticus D15-8W]
MSRSVQQDDEEFTQRAGTASPVKVIKAGCGIRFGEDELAEGIDFSGVERLKPDTDSPSGEDRPVEPHDKSAR